MTGRRRTVLVAAGAAVLVAAVLVAGIVSVARSRGPDDGGGDRGGRGAATADGAADRFLSDYVADDGRVVRHDQGGDTVSEGQAYALLVAVAGGDEATFDRVWTWTKTHLQRSDGLFAWRWQDGEVRDESPAADADVDIAGALAAAGRTFDRPDLVEEAKRVADAVLEQETVDAGGGLVLVAGPWARDERIVNPSYLPCGAVDLAATTGDARWRQVAADAVVRVGALADEGLPPDWAVLDSGGALRPVAGPDGADGEGRYGPDAARIPARIGACPGGADVASDLWEHLRPLDGGGDALAYSLDGRRLDDARHAVGLIGAAGAAQAAGDDAAASRLLDRAADLEREHPTYYGAAWLALTDVVLGSGRTEPSTAASAASVGGSLAPTVDAAPVSRSIAWGRSASVQPQPTTTTATTAPPTTAPPTTAPPTTPPTTAPPATTPPTSPATTAPPASQPPATAPPGSGSSTTDPAAIDPTEPESRGSTTTGGASPDPGTGAGGSPGSPATEPGGADGTGTGDLSGSGSPVDQLSADPDASRRDPQEPARRRTGAIALGGLGVAVACGVLTGLRERAHVLRRPRRAASAGDGSRA